MHDEGLQSVIFYEYFSRIFILVAEHLFCRTPLILLPFCKCRSSRSQTFFLNRCSLKLLKFHRKTLVLASLFNRVASLQTWNFIKKSNVVFFFELLLFNSEIFSKHQLFCPCFIIVYNVFAMTPFSSFNIMKVFTSWNSRMRYDISISAADVINIHYSRFRSWGKEI